MSERVGRVLMGAGVVFMGLAVVVLLLPG